VRAALRALRLPREERRAALAALVALLVTVDALGRGGRAHAERRLASAPRYPFGGLAVPPPRLAVLVGAVAKHVPGAECLAQSLVLARMVREAHPHDTVVRIGVRPGDGALAAHAWVEVGGVVLNDTDDVAARFPVIETRPPP
jgi:hypothetical protein